jgi:hypothetical protein
MLVGGIEGCCESKVNADAAAHDLLSIELLADGDCGVDLKERDDDPFERLQWRPCMYRSIVVYRFPDFDEVRWVEDLWL